MVKPRDKSRDPLMPHERDEETGAQSTHGESADETSRERMRRAHDDDRPRAGDRQHLPRAAQERQEVAPA